MTILITFGLIGFLYVAVAKSRHDKSLREEHRRRFDSVYGSTRAGAACSDVGSLGDPK